MDATTQQKYDELKLSIEQDIAQLNAMLSLEEFYLSQEEFKTSEKVGRILERRQDAYRALQALRIEFGE